MREAALDLACRIREGFAYEPGATEVSTPLAAVLEQRSGVCQDFAHAMIAGLRGLGVPAAYVSGYLRTVAPPGGERLTGADATHAWVAVWAGPDAGWFGVDPTNGVVAGVDHVELALGRDYSDVAPLSGRRARQRGAQPVGRGRRGAARAGRSGGLSLRRGVRPAAGSVPCRTMLDRLSAKLIPASFSAFSMRL